ncbi:MAG: alpha/beta hydrolase, partial [Pseudohongiellaceae bacterium]
NRIDKFAVMDTGVHPVQPGEPEKRQELLDLADRQGMQAVADTWLRRMIHPDRHQDQDLIAAINGMILRNSVADFRGQVKALLGRADQSRYLLGIRQHVLLICGDHDTWSPVVQHETMIESLPGSMLAIVKDSGHMTTMEQPEQVNEILLNWWLD